MGNSNRKKVKMSGFQMKKDMYATMLANFVTGDTILPSGEKLDRTNMNIGYSQVTTATQVSKWYIVSELPDWIVPQWKSNIRARCVLPGVKINYYTFGEPHKIRWDSQEMKNKISDWKNYAKNHESEVSAFEYRSKRKSMQTKSRLINSTLYLNVAELDQRRTLTKVCIFIEVVGERTDEALINMRDCIASMNEMCAGYDIKIKPLKTNLIDWMQSISLFSLRSVKEVRGKFRKRVLTDDIVASMESYKQGRVGERGAPLGMDIMRKEQVMYMFKDDPNKIENWLICAMSGGGKSYFTKNILTWLFAMGITVLVLDYEGDEYSNLLMYVKQSNPEQAKLVSMGKGSEVYLDPMPIPDLTGDPLVDNDLKEQAMGYTLNYFRVMVVGPTKPLSMWQESVINEAISRVYSTYGITDDKDTWSRSKPLRISMVYDEIADIVDSREFADDTTDNIKHKAALEVLESCKPYFESGGAKSGTFRKPIKLQDLLRANFVDFSFGMKGADSSQTDPTILALKQLSVSNIVIQVANYCKYVKHNFSLIVWEEFQRWIENTGSAEIICNAITGGRKRGQINFVVTNDLGKMLDETNIISRTIFQNISHYAIGKINDIDVIHNFCTRCNMKEIEGELLRIAKESNQNSGNVKSNGKKKSLKRAAKGRYNKAFCVVLDNGKKAICKVMLPKSIAESQLYQTGVVLGNENEVENI